MEKKRVKLVPAEERHIGLIVRWRNSEAVRRFFIYSKDFTEESHKKWVEENINTGKAVQFMIVDLNGEEIGVAYLHNIDHVNETAEVGIYIGEEGNRSKGYGVQGMELIVAYGFSKLHLHKIYARVLSTNISSLNHLIKVGFKQEGRLIDEVKIEDEYKDVIRMFIINNQI